jgi:hypothetical protein
MPLPQATGASHVLALDTRGGLAFLLLTGLIQGPDAQQVAPPGPLGGLIQPGDGVPADVRHHPRGVPDRVVEQPLGLVRAAVTDPFGDRPPVAFGQVAGDRTDVLAGL